MDSLQFRRGPPDPQDVPPELAPFIDSPFELHADEMTCLAQGGKLPYLEELLNRENPLLRRPKDAAAGTGSDG
jgi:hypothetical protein